MNVRVKIMKNRLKPKMLKREGTALDPRELEHAVTRLLSLSIKALGKDADPTDHMRYVTQIFTYGKSAESEDKKIRLLRGCYGRLFPESSQSELNL